MLFGNEAATRVEGLWSEVVRAGDNRANLWHEGWDAPLDILVACYGAATATHAPEAWRSVIVQGRALRLALESCDGFEHPIFVAVTRLTDGMTEAFLIEHPRPAAGEIGDDEPGIGSLLAGFDSRDVSIGAEL